MNEGYQQLPNYTPLPTFGFLKLLHILEVPIVLNLSSNPEASQFVEIIFSVETQQII